MSKHASSSPKISLTTASIVGMNAMIGAGIFAVPAALGAYVGPAGLITYVFVILAVLCMGLSMAQLSWVFPQEGSFYVYASSWAGHYGGMIAASSYIIGLTVAMGLLLQSAGINLYTLMPVATPVVWSIFILSIIFLSQCKGIKITATGQYILLALTLLPIVLTILLCLATGSFTNYFPFMPKGAMPIISAMKAVIFGFFGFECASSLFNIVENPKRNVPRALIISILLVGLLYTSFVAAIIYAIPLEAFNNPQTPIAEILATILPGHTWLATLIQISIVSAIIGTLHSMIWSSSVLLRSFLQHMHIKSLQQALKKNTINQNTTLFVICVSILCSNLFIHSLDIFFSLTAISIIFAFMCSMVALLVHPATKKNLGTVLITLLGLVTASIIVYYAAYDLRVALNL